MTSEEYRKYVKDTLRQAREQSVTDDYIMRVPVTIMVDFINGEPFIEEESLFLYRKLQEIYGSDEFRIITSNFGSVPESCRIGNSIKLTVAMGIYIGIHNNRLKYFFDRALMSRGMDGYQ